MKQPYEIIRVSPVSKKANTLTIILDMEDYAKWESGKELIQRAMPYLTPDEREFLMTGIIEEEWEKLFPPKEPDELSQIYDYMRSIGWTENPDGTVQNPDLSEVWPSWLDAIKNCLDVATGV